MKKASYQVKKDMTEKKENTYGLGSGIFIKERQEDCKLMAEWWGKNADCYLGSR